LATTPRYARNFQQLEEAKEREKMAIRGAFERYVAPSVVDRVLRSPDEMRLGGHRREISILFADIRGYTTSGDGYHLCAGRYAGQVPWRRGDGVL
jgi:class 3 adenylate cyclase